MANKNLANAKNAKNDEFYTQFSDIQKEVESYLEYDPNTFKGKVIYSNCDDPFESNFFRYFVLNFNRLGLKRLISTSYKPSPVANTQITLFGDDVTLKPVKGRPKIVANKFIINEVGDVDGDGSFTLEDIAKQLKANKNNEWTPLEGDGDFRSDECLELLKQSDIVVTNPPFSLFREYISQLAEHKKKFLVIGNQNSITLKEIFPLVKDNKIWFGYSKVKEFNKPDGSTQTFGNVGWFTNLDHGRRHQPLSLMTISDNRKFNKKLQGKQAYEKYDNFDAIEVPFVDAIPSNYDGVMGVPVSFLDKYNPEQFEIVGLTKTWFGAATKIYPEQIQVGENNEKSKVTKLNDGAVLKINEPPKNKTYYIVKEKLYRQTFPRLLVKQKKK
ncbi:MAG: adenine-specific methyltransferase EcoRI family protein [bacterium]|nr:adenine-specific methyltransferase EcoRI family protein [bacterium]